ncbi:MAG: MarR family winged helix-turn-helix transcriptional regulator [Spirochaetota bacterium]
MKARRASRSVRTRIARDQRTRARRSEAGFDPLQTVIKTCPGYNLGKAYKKVTRLFEEEFRSSDLTLPQFAVLVNTGLTESATASEIAERLGSDLSTISRTMELLVRRGLVEQSRAQDRRVRVYRLTPSGRAAVDGTLPKWRNAKQRVLEDVDPVAWKTTLHTLRQLAG